MERVNMPRVFFTNHAKIRMKQRGITSLEVFDILKFPRLIKKSFSRRQEYMGFVNNRKIKVVLIKKEKYIKIITVI